MNVTTLPAEAAPAPAPASDSAVVSAVLRRALQGDGGFPERTGGGFSPAATAWAALALARHPGSLPIAVRAAERLATAQSPDGRVAVAEGHANAVWPTPLALLAWQATDTFPEPRDRAERFLLAVSGAVVEIAKDSDGSPVGGHDGTIPGWPWILGTHSWVEPTALAVLALRNAGRATHPRVQQGVRLLLDRQLSRGGWNYGNTTVYGTELVPQLDATGAALTALAGLVPAEAVTKSVSLLESGVAGVRTPLSLSWGILGLSAWGRRPSGAAARVDESLALAEKHGGYGTTLLAMLLLARDFGEAFSP